ncbi:ras association domain-containing protein 5 [Eucyclogobius newberryi]|uniref:ras association domain-containing protein 5 n=1 Tax=Eucyclogobius newberryi TaxID=166745 RepID=UPI003B5A00F6
MFNVVHQGRKCVPRAALSGDAPLGVQPVNITSRATVTEAPELTWPPPDSRMRVSKDGKAVVRRHLSPQAKMDILEWHRGGPSEGTAQDRLHSPSERRAGAQREAPEGNDGLLAGGPPRNRKKGFRPPDVRTIFTEERDPRVKEESGEGHVFRAIGLGSWCDVCCQYMLQSGLTCAGCKYACHAACRDRVSLDCNAVLSPLSPDPVNNNNTPEHDVEKDRELRTECSREEIRQRIELYNSLTKDHLKMTLGRADVYTGFIKVQMDLRRPVTVRGGQRGPAGEAFYLPRGAINTLHVSSSNTVKEVIVALLNKFTVADNPAKYALYKCYRREEQVHVYKLGDAEKPLFLRLMAGPNLDTLSFVLREQQTGEVMWDAFSIPELRNFLQILEKEEDDQKEAVMRRYNMYRQRLQEALQHVRALS